jgi:hypothetical protein
MQNNKKILISVGIAALAVAGGALVTKLPADNLIAAGNKLIDWLNYAAVNIPWEAVAASGVLSGLLLGPQKLVKKYVQHNEQVMIVLVGVSGIVVAGVHYLATAPTTNPKFIALQGLALSFLTQPFYFIVWKPLVKLLSDSFVQAAAVDEQVISAKVPAAGLGLQPGSTVPITPADDFSQ